MKRILIGTVVLSMLSIMACKKSASVNGGSWTFKSKTYTVTSAIANSTTDNSLVAISSSGNNYDEIIFTWMTLPTANGNYTVVSGAPDTTGTQVGVSMSLTTAPTYAGSTYLPGTNTVVANVTVANGQIKVVMPAVDMVNTTDATDHSAVAGTIMQTGQTQ